MIGPTWLAVIFGVIVLLAAAGAAIRIIAAWRSQRATDYESRSPQQQQRAREIDVLTVDQLNRYLAAIPEARRVPLLLAGWCGVRSGEVRGLRLRDLGLDAGVVHARQPSYDSTQCVVPQSSGPNILRRDSAFAQVHVTPQNCREREVAVDLGNPGVTLPVSALLRLAGLALHWSIATGWTDGVRPTTPGTGSSRPQPITSGLLAALRVLHQRVGPRKHQRLLSVVVAHEVRRCSVRSPNLDDLECLVGRTCRPAVHAQPVTYYCTHGNSSQRSYPADCTLPRIGGRGAAPQATDPTLYAQLRRTQSPAVDAR